MSVNQKTCPDIYLLKKYLAGNVSFSEVDEFEEHISECLECQQKVTLAEEDPDGHSNYLINLARNAFATGQTFQLDVSDQDHSDVADLIQRMQNVATLESRWASQETLEDVEHRAAEVQRLLKLSEVEGSLGRIGSFEVWEVLGAGSTGVVYRAVHIELKREVALKVLRPSLGKVARERFLIEAQAAARISHPNIVQIYEVGSDENLAYIAMSWTPGETLAQKLSREGKLDEDGTKELVIQVARGLAAAHQSGVIHRDIKPANIWIESGTNRAQILDFGLVRVTDTNPQLTCTGMIAGTPSFMSPEQARGAELDERSDFFSLGCVLYRALTGNLPFESSNVLATLQAIQQDNPIAPSEVDARVSQDLSLLTMCLLEKDPNRRPATASDIESVANTTSEKWSFLPVSNRKILDITAKKQNKSSSVGRGKGFVVGLIGLAFAAFLFFMMPQIIRIVLDQGELVIRTNDPNVKIEVLADGQRVHIIDLKTQQQITIKSGEYELQPVSDDNSITIDKTRITLSRGDKEIVSVNRIPRNPSTASSEGFSAYQSKSVVDNKKWNQNLNSISLLAKRHELLCDELANRIGAEHPLIKHHQRFVRLAQLKRQFYEDPKVVNSNEVAKIVLPELEVFLVRQVEEYKRLMETANEVEQLELHRARLLGKYRQTHPEVVGVESAIQKALSIPEKNAISDEVQQLLVEQASLKQKMVPKHPRLRAIAMQLAVLGHKASTSNKGRPEESFSSRTPKNTEQDEPQKSTPRTAAPDQRPAQANNKQVIDAYMSALGGEEIKEYAARLQDLQARKQILLNTYTQNHVAVTQVEMEIQQLQEKLSQLHQQKQQTEDEQRQKADAAQNAFADLLRTGAMQSRRHQADIERDAKVYDLVGRIEFEGVVPADVPEKIETYLFEVDKRKQQQKLIGNMTLDDKRNEFRFMPLHWRELGEDEAKYVLVCKAEGFRTVFIEDTTWLLPIQREKASRPFLGITMTVPENQPGIKVTNVIKESAAEKSGLRVNDVVWKVGDSEIKDIADFRDRLEVNSVGDELVLHVKRISKELTVTTKLPSRKEFQHLLPPPSRRKIDTTIGMKKAATLRGQIKDRSGNPVEDVDISIYSVMPSPIVGLGSTKSNKNGDFEIDDACPFEPHKVGKNSVRSATSFIVESPWIGKMRVYTSKVPNELQLTFGAANHVSGRLISSDGKPIANVMINAQSRNSGLMISDDLKAGLAVPFEWITAKTDEDGRFEMIMPADSKFNLMIDEKVGLMPPTFVDFGGKEGSDNDVGDIRLLKGVAVRGRVIDSETGEPLKQKISIGWHGPDRPKSSAAIRSVKTNANGQFFARMVPGENFPYISSSTSEFGFDTIEYRLPNGKVIKHGEPIDIVGPIEFNIVIRKRAPDRPDLFLPSDKQK